MKISLIVAMDKNRVIGKDNQLPWKLPNDLAYVREVTANSTLILGRKNIESIGKALPDRTSVVMTKNRDYAFPGCLTAHSVPEALDLCQKETEVFVFGGEKIYETFMPYVEKMYITQIDHEFEGDTFFPEVDLSGWKETTKIKGIKDEKNPYDYHFHVFEK